MTTLAPTVAPALTGDVAASKLGDVLRSERTKFRTLASSWWTLLTVLVGTIAVGLITCWAVVAHWDQMSLAEKATLDPTFKSLIGLFIGQVAVGILGVLAITSEYATGMIRTTFAAVPRRRVVLTAKAAVTGATTLVVGELGAFASFFLAQAILSRRNLGVSLAEPTVARAVLVEGMLLFVCAMIGVGLGAMIRPTAGAVAVLVGLFYLPALLNVLPPPWNNRIGRFTLIDAAQQASALNPNHDLFSPAISVLILLAWPAAVVLAAALLITRRDE